MNETKVKAYGLINLTKRQYTITQSIVFGILVLLFLLSFFYNLDRYMFGQAKIIILAIALLEGIETFVMFKKFRKKQK